MPFKQSSHIYSWCTYAYVVFSNIRAYTLIEASWCSFRDVSIINGRLFTSYIKKRGYVANWISYDVITKSMQNKIRHVGVGYTCMFPTHTIPIPTKLVAKNMYDVNKYTSI